MPLRAVGRELAALAPPLALAALGVVFGLFAADRSAAPWSTALALLAAGVLAVLGSVGTAPRAGGAVISLALAPAIFLLGAEEPLRLAAWSALLAAAVVLVAADTPSAKGFGARGWLALALATQAIVHADRLLVAPSSAGTLMTVVALPCAAALLLAALERADPSGAFVAALASFAAGPGWTLLGLAPLAAGAALGRGRASRRFAASTAAIAASGVAVWNGEPRWVALALGGLAAAALLSGPTPARAGRALLGAAALVALIAGGLPWRRPAPLAAVLRRAADLATTRVDQLSFAGRPRTLSVSRASLELPLAGRPIRRLVIDSFLIDGAALPCGSPVARIELRRGAERLFEGEIRVGEGTTEWAAERADLEGKVACLETSAPTAWLPGGGRFLARRDRARLHLPEPADADLLVFERHPDLPDSVSWVLIGAATWR